MKRYNIMSAISLLLFAILNIEKDVFFFIYTLIIFGVFTTIFFATMEDIHELLIKLNKK